MQDQETPLDQAALIRLAGENLALRVRCEVLEAELRASREQRFFASSLDERCLKADRRHRRRSLLPWPLTDRPTVWPWPFN